jgi:hypothetical protein
MARWQPLHVAATGQLNSAVELYGAGETKLHHR